MAFRTSVGFECSKCDVTDGSFVYFRYFMALVQEMAVKIDQGFLGAILALFTPAADPQADRKKVEQSSRLMVQLTDTFT